jgi:hypothetical protein
VSLDGPSWAHRGSGLDSRYEAEVAAARREDMREPDLENTFASEDCMGRPWTEERPCRDRWKAAAPS